MSSRVVVALIGIALVLASSPAGAQSPLGQPVAEHVTLVYAPADAVPRITCGLNGRDDMEFFRAVPDATREAAPFHVPEGRRLLLHGYLIDAAGR